MGIGVVTVALALVTAAVPAQADDDVTLTGVVLAEDGRTDTGAEVTVSPEGGGTFREVPVDAEGRFEIEGLAPGRYYVSAADTRGTYREFGGAYWDGESSTVEYPGAVELTAGVQEIAFELAYAQGVRVRAVGEQGQPLPGIVLNWEAYQREQDRWLLMPSDPPVTDADGYALATPFFDGDTFRVCAADIDYSSDRRPEVRHATACWEGADDAAGATPIVFEPGDRIRDLTIPMQVEGRSLFREHAFTHGTLEVGEPVTVEPGQWGPVPVDLTYEWGWFDETDAFVVVSTEGPTFVPTSDLDGRYLHVRITGTAPGYVTPPAVSVNAGVVGAPRAAVESFTLDGSATAGTVVTARIGATTPADATTEVRWYADGALLQDAFGEELPITDELAGAAISASLRVYDFTFGEPSELEERYAFAVIPGELTTATPSITGDAEVGGELVADAGTWGPEPVRLAYQWQRDGDPIPGATTAGYAPVAADDGAVLTVAVTGSRYLYESQTAVSDGRLVGDAIDAGTPTISGPMLPQPKSSLIADPGTWGPEGVALSYQWYRGSTPIRGATSPWYVVAAADRGSSLSVEVTGTVPGQEPVSVRSAGTRMVGLGGITRPPGWDT